MKRKTIVLLVVIVAILAGGGWMLRWYWSNPRSVFQDSFAKANAGRYAEATQNLPSGNRQQFAEDSKLMREVWDTVTRKQTVAEVVIEKVDLDFTGEMGKIHFIVKYQDGTSLDGRETVARQRASFEAKW